jgi:DNA-binding SARP family transcriptional activator
MEFRILGPLEVFEGDRRVALGGPKQRALLAVLLLHANEVVASERLIDELWGEHPPATAAKSVQLYVSRLRKELHSGPNGLLLTQRGGYVLRVEPGQFDVHRFERSLRDGRRALEDEEPDRAAEILHEGLALWRGNPLWDFSYEPFAQPEIARLEELRSAALEERIEADLALGRHADVVIELETLVAQQPLRERLRGQLMLALYRCDRQAEALEVYRRGRRLLVEGLGLEPVRRCSASSGRSSPSIATSLRPRGAAGNLRCRHMRRMARAGCRCLRTGRSVVRVRSVRSASGCSRSRSGCLRSPGRAEWARRGSR